MYGILSEESLNYHLIMEGFYYDAEIQHIAEIVKNTLYFAVLEGDQSKTIKNTYDTYYFSIDDELLYVNYYFDFGPLNISCVYKYCTKLNSYMQYAQGLKRVVHYTSANPARRVNAAFLIGCYTIIYFNMEPKEIYRILLATGGPFKSYLDASQGASQYTLRLLDCFYAIQKTFAYNFFNFTDFNVSEYDSQTKLQNGDMNWLVPRKFLAFIGPTESELMSGHPPDFYIKYFLENDIKTVIRLNNKVYDPMPFTAVGIEHHELFFPDGTVPTKQILLRFLQISENSRAAIGVHCKAGLGRTGSLIGAYIVKHYRLTAHEAIAWMRVCRPGSVIGQQQSWLEKIENWLWRQGSQYRLQHFGEGDKIPHHRYGIYSKEWPKDKNKLMRHVQRRKVMTQTTCCQGRDVTENSSHFRHTVDYPPHSSIISKKPVMKSHNAIPKALPITEKVAEEDIKIAKLLNRIQRSRTKPIEEANDSYKIENVTPSNPRYHQNISSNNSIKPKPLVNASKVKDSSDFEGDTRSNKVNNSKPKRYNTAPAYDCYEPEGRKVEFTDDFSEARTSHVKCKRRNQSESREPSGEKTGVRIRRQFVENLEQTQGDKLIEIKAQRDACMADNNISANKTKQVKAKKRSNKITNVDMYSRPQASTSKKTETESSAFTKRSYQERNLYPPRL